MQPTPFITFQRKEWSTLRDSTPLTLSETDLEVLHGINEKISLAEIETIYLPLSRLLNLYVESTQSLHKVTNTFLGETTTKVPFVIGIAGSVAVGKSTTARVLQALLSRWPNHPKVDIITTDGFLYPTAELTKRDLMSKKGFPESYNRKALLKFIADVKSGVSEVSAPIYSHLIYDILPDKKAVVTMPDIVILEGLNVLQTDFSKLDTKSDKKSFGFASFVSDYFDFSIYVDAKEELIKKWYIERFLTLRSTSFRDPASYFHRYAKLTDQEAINTATKIWEEINGVNLKENILPTRYRARLILEKSEDHLISGVKLRKI